jgi:hypothetical protein
MAGAREPGGACAARGPGPGPADLAGELRAAGLIQPQGTTGLAVMAALAAFWTIQGQFRGW